MLRTGRFWLPTAAIVTLATLVVAVPVAARTQVDVRGGYYTDAEEAFFGGGLVADLSGSWDFNPNVEWVLVDGYDYLTANADVHYDFAASPNMALWAGGGLAVQRFDYDESAPPRANNDTDVGLNLLAGLGASQGSVRPYFQVKGVVADHSETSLGVGVRF